MDAILLQNMMLICKNVFYVAYTRKTNKPIKFEFDMLNCYRDSNYF